MPFLWVIPLSLYLLTFIVAFDHPRWYKPVPIAILTIIAIYFVGVGKGGTDLFDYGLPGKFLHWFSDTFASWRGTSKDNYPASPTITISLIPYLIIDHVVGTRVQSLLGYRQAYTAVLPRIWGDPAIKQTALVICAWTHGCIGIPKAFAAKVFDAVRTGDEVLIVAGQSAGVEGVSAGADVAD